MDDNGKYLNLEDIKGMDIDKILDLYRQGYKLHVQNDEQSNYSNRVSISAVDTTDTTKTAGGCSSCAEKQARLKQQELSKTSGPILKLGTPNCVSSVPSGVTRSITVGVNSLQLGTPPYVYTLYEDAAPIGRYPDTGTTTDAIATFTYNFPNVGPHAYKARIDDSCTGGGLFDESACTVTVGETICSWITGIGGIAGINSTRINTLADANLGIGSIGFTPTIPQVFGAIYYYIGFVNSGNVNTGCSF